MLINNHFYSYMNVIDKLNKELSNQDFTEESLYGEELNKYRHIACNYANIENAIAVLSDMHANISYIYHGGFSKVLGMKTTENKEVHSIWEEEILKQIHPDDLSEKYLEELRFFHFIKHQPKNKRGDYYLISKLRMKDASGSYIPVLHRLFYISVPSRNSLWLALCLYNPLAIDTSHKSIVVNSANGQVIELGEQNDSKVLSDREKQVLRLIDKGMSSKDIAKLLSISINTVSRHRQEILHKLQVKNSIEACRIAKDLRLI